MARLSRESADYLGSTPKNCVCIVTVINKSEKVAYERCGKLATRVHLHCSKPFLANFSNAQPHLINDCHTDVAHKPVGLKGAASRCKIELCASTFHSRLLI
ncbi:hypothetical protein JOD55_001705 [Arcanobacterium pluranimalium]|nr:hypothetical protein [Arcanobacterium pluranimalium]